MERKDETENKTKHIPGQLLSHPPGESDCPCEQPSEDGAPCNGISEKAGQRLCMNQVLNSSFQNCVVQSLPTFSYKPAELGKEISISL